MAMTILGTGAPRKSGVQLAEGQYRSNDPSGLGVPDYYHPKPLVGTANPSDIKGKGSAYKGDRSKWNGADWKTNYDDSQPRSELNTPGEPIYDDDGYYGWVHPEAGVYIFDIDPNKPFHKSEDN